MSACEPTQKGRRTWLWGTYVIFFNLGNRNQWSWIPLPCESLNCLSISQIFTSLLPTSRMASLFGLRKNFLSSQSFYCTILSILCWMGLSNMAHDPGRSWAFSYGIMPSPALFPLPFTLTTVSEGLGRPRSVFLEHFPFTYAPPCNLLLSSDAIIWVMAAVVGTNFILWEEPSIQTISHG